jgi:hypothetical protein
MYTLKQQVVTETEKPDAVMLVNLFVLNLDADLIDASTLQGINVLHA